MTASKSRKSMSTGAVILQPRDIGIIRLITAYGWLSKRQLSAFLGCTETALVRRLRSLAAVGVIGSGHRGMANEVLYTSTRLGRKHAGMEEFRTGSPTVQVLNHSAALVAAALRFSENPANGFFISEAEVQNAVRTGKLSARILAAAPWAAAQFSPAHLKQWAPAAAAVSGAGAGWKRPDALLLREGSLESPLPPVLIEVELSLKSNVASYIRILESYDAAIKSGVFAETIFYVVARCVGTGKAIERALQTALATANESKKMTVKVQVATLGLDRFQPVSFSRGLFPQGPAGASR